MPADWSMVCLGEVLKPVKRPVAVEQDKEYRTLGIRWYGNGAFLKASKPGSQILTKKLNAVASGDVTYSKLFAWKGSFAVVSDACQGAVASSEFPTYVANPARLLPEYFALWASRVEVWDVANDMSTGTTAGSRNRLAPDQFLELTIDLPPIADQRAIVASANLMQEGVNAYAREARAAETVLRSARESMLHTHGAWTELPKSWRTRQLDEIASIRSGIAKGRKPRGDMVERPFIRAANVQDGFLDLSEIKTLMVSKDEVARFGLAADDVLLTEGGSAEHVGRGWLWAGELEGAVSQNHVFRVRVNDEEVAPRFLAYAIGASPARAYCLSSAKKTTNLASINKTQVGRLSIPVPPAPVQAEIVRRLDLLREVAARGAEVVRCAARVRSVLVSELVGGKRSPLRATI